MADAYIHSTGSGTSPYDTWEKAANSAAQAQAVFDAAVAGETIHAAGIITLAAQLDIDLNEGNITSGFIKVIGYNASHVNDGTRFILDGNNAATNVLYNNSMNYWYFENIEVKNSNGGNGFTGNVARYNIFLNCCAHNCDAYGFDTYAYLYSIWVKCISYSNTGTGFGTSNTGNRFLFCRARDNGGHGWHERYSTYTGTMIGCISDHNGDEGINGVNGNTLINCVVDDNTDNGIQAVAAEHLTVLLGCRVTNHDGAGDIGVNALSQFLITGWNYFQDNDGANIQNAAMHYELLDDGSGTDAEDQGDTESGYVDEDDPEDYNLIDAATSRRTGIQIPVS